MDECYSQNTYIKVYSHVINPLNGPNLWERVRNPQGIIIAPSPVKQQRGRRPTVRRKEAEELENRAQEKASKKKSKQKTKLTGLLTVKCSVCGQLGHNKRHHSHKGGDTNGCNVSLFNSVTLLHFTFLVFEFTHLQ